MNHDMIREIIVKLLSYPHTRPDKLSAFVRWYRGVDLDFNFQEEEQTLFVQTLEQTTSSVLRLAQLGFLVHLAIDGEWLKRHLFKALAKAPNYNLHEIRKMCEALLLSDNISFHEIEEGLSISRTPEEVSAVIASFGDMLAGAKAHTPLQENALKRWGSFNRSELFSKFLRVIEPVSGEHFYHADVPTLLKEPFERSLFRWGYREKGACTLYVEYASVSQEEADVFETFGLGLGALLEERDAELCTREKMSMEPRFRELADQAVTQLGWLNLITSAYHDDDQVAFAFRGVRRGA